MRDLSNFLLDQEVGRRMYVETPLPGELAVDFRTRLIDEARAQAASLASPLGRFSVVFSVKFSPATDFYSSVVFPRWRSREPV